ncbi:MAG: Uma2 family endonuclease [Phycisphaerae bacterium]
MSAVMPFTQRREPQYLGLRMSADAYFALEQDGFDYELVNGVMVQSLGRTPRHQHVAFEIAWQLRNYIQQNPVGLVLMETDVHLGQTPTGDDLVYRPDVVFLCSERAGDIKDRIIGAPDLVVEVVSGSSRRFDSETKREDYERYGVGEFWLIDPDQGRMTFFRLKEGRFVEVPTTGDSFASEAVPGFKLDLACVRKAFTLM